METFAGFVMFGVLLAFYFLPALVAGSRRHHQLAAIVCLNFFLGWTLIGWVASLCWGLTNPPRVVQTDGRVA